MCESVKRVEMDLTQLKINLNALSKSVARYRERQRQNETTLSANGIYDSKTEHERRKQWAKQMMKK